VLELSLALVAPTVDRHNPPPVCLPLVLPDLATS
jgi:hypothetical protein